ncbi:DUF317 domain-containing protein [Streptomyces sp. cf124]|uniref:DUF317 domain-containing protein n=1 Tax=Streptomyces sp. cf124 TaxID=1761903 RepID=UPI0021093301|nr:DUF317 domain-containing protein [Streptomyces sp. cf124]
MRHLAEGDAWGTAVGSPVDEKTVTAATKPLTDAGWKHTVDGRWIRWTNPSRDADIQFDAFAAQQPNSTLATWTIWTIWAGPSIDHPTWSVTASPHTPSTLLADLTETLAHRNRHTTPPPHTDRARLPIHTGHTRASHARHGTNSRLSRPHRFIGCDPPNPSQNAATYS